MPAFELRNLRSKLLYLRRFNISMNIQLKSPLDEIDFASVNDDPGQCQRLFHGRGKCYPHWEHINIDWLPPVVLITLYQAMDETIVQQLASVLMDLLPNCRSVKAQYRYHSNGPFCTLLGETFGELEANESGLKFHLQLGKNRNTGLFLDMRNGRQWVRNHAKDKHVLNLFAYTCGFSVAAMAGGAKCVVNVDNNKSVLRKGRENHRLNGHSTEHVIFEGVDIFKSYSRLKKYAPYDLLICDPPTYQSGSVNVVRDYKKIIRRVPQLMQAGGELLLCLNSPELTPDFLHHTVAEECSRCKYMETLPPPAVFREAHPGRGLKILRFQYRDD